jgi:cytochrome bd-type quinol oxidase subunit 2
MKKITTLFASISLLVFGAVMFTPAVSYAGLFEEATNEACSGAALSNDGCTPGQGEEKVNDTLATVISVLSIVLGVISVIMIIVGGIKFTTSQGDGASTSSARNTIIYAVVGLVVAVIAQGIVRFVLGRL